MRTAALMFAGSAALAVGLAVAPNVVMWALVGAAFAAVLRDRGVRR